MAVTYYYVDRARWGGDGKESGGAPPTVPFRDDRFRHVILVSTKCTNICIPQANEAF